VPVAYGGRQPADLQSEAVGPLERAHRRRGPVAVAGDDVVQDGARLDGRQLVGVSEEHEPRVRADRLDEPGHHRQRDHRGLIDDDDVVGQPVAAVVPEPAVVVGAEAEHPVQGRRGQAGDDGPVGLGEGLRPGRLRQGL
jgi:hypothetical protein